LGRVKKLVSSSRMAKRTSLARSRLRAGQS
jgi:hypothetical protein